MVHKAYLKRKQSKKPRQVELKGDLFTELELFKLLRDRHGSVLAEIMMRVRSRSAFIDYCTMHKIVFDGPWASFEFKSKA